MTNFELVCLLEKLGDNATVRLWAPVGNDIAIREIHEVRASLDGTVVCIVGENLKTQNAPLTGGA